MTFKDKLNSYMNELNCSSRDISKISGISETVISRYKNGKRTPKINSNQFKSLVEAIYNISKESKKNYSKSQVEQQLILAINHNNTFDHTSFSKNLNELISTLNINTTEMAKYIAFDASYISRVRYNKTKPADPQNLASKICNYIIAKYNNPTTINSILSILNISDIKSEEELYLKLYEWLTINKSVDTINHINNFLETLDNFNLDDYIEAIKFNELKIPYIPFYKAKTKNYYGIENMKNGELNFFKATVLSKSKEDIYMCSDMPMEDMAQDLDFGKKWMYGIALCLKKGLKLNIIHNLDRPFNEMMLGLESWIPIYMTGQVVPFYLKEVKNSVYQHLNYTSGVVALTGECIIGNHNKGKYYLTVDKKEIAYYKEKTKLLFKKAKPLMDIYREKDYSIFNKFLKEDSVKKGNRKRIYSSLPIFTIDEQLLLEILKDNNISDEEIKLIINYKNHEEKNNKNIIKDNIITDIIWKPSREEFDQNPIKLNLENIFCDKKIIYNYEQFTKHFNSTIKYSKLNSNYNIIVDKYQTFKNINITIVEGKYVILSKNANPIIHFVIKHPKLVDAISKFETPIRE